MNYKKIIKKRSTREAILRILSFIPDKQMLQIQWFIKMGCILNLKDPQRFTEKLQYYKLYYRNPLMKLCVDKHDVRSYVKECGLSDILNEEIGIYNDPSEIDFETLPKSYVVKDTLGCGGNAVILVSDKENVEKKTLITQMQQWVNTPFWSKHPGREWVYEGRQHRIIIEKFIETSTKEGGLVDWKFFCFNGRAEYIYVIADRAIGNGASLGIFDRDFNYLPYNRIDERPLKRFIMKPTNYIELRTCAERLSEPFPEARIDLYNQNGKIIFGEITFFDGSGYMKFEPDDFDFILGKKFTLPV